MLFSAKTANTETLVGEGVEDGQLLKTGDKVVFAGDKEKKIYTIAKEPFIWKGLYVVTLWEQLTRPVKVSSLRKVERIDG